MNPRKKRYRHIHEPVFELIKSLNKAEKRNFKLYAMRLDQNRDSKFIQMFAAMDGMVHYDENRIMQLCRLTPEQCSNVKSHLYRQILTSLRNLSSNVSEEMDIRRQLDFANILFNRGLYWQSNRILEKVKSRAEKIQSYGLSVEALDLETKIGMAKLKQNIFDHIHTSNDKLALIGKELQTLSELTDLSMRAYSLYNKLGSARSQDDLDRFERNFKPTLDKYQNQVQSFHEKFQLYRAYAWYYYFQNDQLRSYRYASRWVDLFDKNSQMKEVIYENYMRGCEQILEGLYLMGKHKQFKERLLNFEKEFEELSKLNLNAHMIAQRIILTNRIHLCFLEGEFSDGLQYVPFIDEYIANYDQHISVHSKMLLYYKVACLYFGEGLYRECMEYLAKIIETKNPDARRDVQCFARILNLISCYDAGIDYDLEDQIRSVYGFLSKMDDLGQVQKIMLAFLKNLGRIYAGDINKEFKILHEKLEKFAENPYELRTFYYLDILSWLESKVTDVTVGDIIRRKFREKSQS